MKPGVAPLSAGPWVQDKGGYYVQAWIGEFRADEEFDIQGERRELNYADGSWRHSVLEERSAGLYAEYGLTRQLTFIGQLPWKRLTRTATDILEPINPHIRHHSSGLGDLSLGLRLRLLSTRLACSLQVVGRMPAGYRVGPAPNEVEDTPYLPRGNGAHTLSVELLAGRSFSRLYASGGLGYHFQSGRPEDEILYDLEAGIHLLRSLLFKGALDGSRTRASRLRVPLRVATIADRDLLKFNCGLLFSHTAGFELSLDRVFYLSGRNTPSGSQTFLALALKG